MRSILTRRGDFDLMFTITMLSIAACKRSHIDTEHLGLVFLKAPSSLRTSVASNC